MAENKTKPTSLSVAKFINAITDPIRRADAKALDAHGEVELVLECWGETVRVQGDSVKLELIGAAKYVDEYHPLGDTEDSR